MRIISGQFKGRNLKSYKGREVRPTLDRVKESIFNILGEKLTHARVLDLFAGCGNLGLEALSRGAGQVVFCEKKTAVRKIIKDNLALLKINEAGYKIQGDVFLTAKKLYNQSESFDLIFADPPYQELVRNIKSDTGPVLLVEYFLDLMNNCCLLNAQGILVIEHFKKIRLNPMLENLYCFKNNMYSTVQVSFYKRR